MVCHLAGGEKGNSQTVRKSISRWFILGLIRETRFPLPKSKKTISIQRKVIPTSSKQDKKEGLWSLSLTVVGVQRPVLFHSVERQPLPLRTFCSCSPLSSLPCWTKPSTPAKKRRPDFIIVSSIWKASLQCQPLL